MRQPKTTIVTAKDGKDLQDQLYKFLYDNLPPRHKRPSIFGERKYDSIMYYFNGDPVIYMWIDEETDTRATAEAAPGTELTYERPSSDKYEYNGKGSIVFPEDGKYTLTLHVPSVSAIFAEPSSPERTAKLKRFLSRCTEEQRAMVMYLAYSPEVADGYQLSKKEYEMVSKSIKDQGLFDYYIYFANTLRDLWLNMDGLAIAGFDAVSRANYYTDMWDEYNKQVKLYNTIISSSSEEDRKKNLEIIQSGIDSIQQPKGLGVFRDQRRDIVKIGYDEASRSFVFDGSLLLDGLAEAFSDLRYIFPRIKAYDELFERLRQSKHFGVDIEVLLGGTLADKIDQFKSHTTLTKQSVLCSEEGQEGYKIFSNIPEYSNTEADQDFLTTLLNDFERWL